MADPLRVRPNQNPPTKFGGGSSFGSSGFGGGRFGSRTFTADWSSGSQRSGGSNTSYIDKALDRRDMLQQLGVSTLEEDDIHKMIDDPTGKKRITSLLTDQEILSAFGPLSELDISTIRSDKNFTEIERARMTELIKEINSGAKVLDVEERHNKFVNAVDGLKDYINDETYSKAFSKTWDGLNWIGDKMLQGTPLEDKPSIGSHILTGMEKVEEFIKRHNHRADALRQTYGAESTLDQQKTASEWGFGKRMLTTWPRLIGAMSGPGSEDYDAPGFLDVKRRSAESELWIPFIDAQTFFSQTVRDLADLGIGSETENKKFFARVDKLVGEGVPTHAANAQAFHERKDLSTFTKFGIEMASDPTVIWGLTLGSLKLVGGGVKAVGGMRASGALRWVPGFGGGEREAMLNIDFTADMRFQEELVNQIKVGNKGTYWSKRPGGLVSYIDELTETQAGKDHKL
jgi:hypothetical protein